MIRRVPWTMIVLGVCAAMCGCCLLPPNEDPEPAVWNPAAAEGLVRALDKSRAAAEKLEGHTCRFYRQERVNNYLGARQQMLVRFRRHPFSLYMRWVDAAKFGAEFLYVAGQYQDKAFARQGGAVGLLLPTLRLGIDDPLIRGRSRHPVTDFGVASASRRLLDSAQRAQRTGELLARDLGRGDVHGEPARGFEMLLPDRPDFYARRVRVWFDPNTTLLKRIEAYNEAGDVLEDYAFTRLRPAAGLTDADFSPYNRAFGFYRFGGGPG